MNVENKLEFRVFLFFIPLFMSISVCFASEELPGLRPEKIHVAETKKNNIYIHDGEIIGGDQAIDSVTIKDIRMAANAGFERTVIDLEGSRNGESVAIQRPPFFQVALAGKENHVTVTIWGHPTLDFKSKKVLHAFSKSSVVRKVVLLPRIEENLWTFRLEVVPGTRVEAFELNGPTRIILDLQKNAHSSVRKS